MKKTIRFDASAPIDYDNDMLDYRMRSEFYAQKQYSKEEAVELLVKAREHDAKGERSEFAKIINTLAKSYMKLACQIVFKYFAGYEESEKRRDLIMGMYEYIYTALVTYDMNSNVSPATFVASYIRSICKSTYTKQNVPSHLSIPAHIAEEIYKINKYKERYLVEYGYYPNDETIISRFGLSKSRYAEIRKLMSTTYISLDDYTNEDNGKIGEVIPDDTDVAEECDARTLSSIFDKVLSSKHISERTALMIRFRFGFIDGDVHSLSETGQWIAQYNIRKGQPRPLTCERVRQQITKALVTLADELRKYGITAPVEA